MTKLNHDRNREWNYGKEREKLCSTLFAKEIFLRLTYLNEIEVLFARACEIPTDINNLLVHTKICCRD